MPRPAGTAGRRSTVPWQLLAAVAHFVGRTRELDGLTGLLRPIREGMPGVAAVSVIAGTAGVGKTALAGIAESKSGLVDDA